MFDLHFDTISSEQKQLLEQLSELELGHLAGGTGLSLQIGHRRSYDLDFVTDKAIDSVVLPTIQSTFSGNSLQQNLLTMNQYTIFIDGIKVTFFLDQAPFYPLLRQNDLSLIDLKDIFSSKLYVMGRRATWRDYVDVAICIDQEFTDFKSGIEDAVARYQVSKRWVLEPLAYFDDLEVTPIEWVKRSYSDDQVKNILTSEIERYLQV